MIRAFIFDCFGVLYHGSTEELYSRCPTNRQNELHDIRIQTDRGRLDYQGFLQAAADLLSISVNDVRAIVQGSHVRNERLFDTVRSIDRTKYKVGMLSNIGDTTIAQMFSKEELATLFDAVILSHQVGMIKPEPGIYRLMAQRLDCKPEECVMIDDIEENCDGAEATGMQSILHVDNAATLKALAQLTVG